MKHFSFRLFLLSLLSFIVLSSCSMFLEEDKEGELSINIGRNSEDTIEDNDSKLNFVVSLFSSSDECLIKEELTDNSITFKRLKRGTYKVQVFGESPLYKTFNEKEVKIVPGTTTKVSFDLKLEVRNDNIRAKATSKGIDLYIPYVENAVKAVVVKDNNTTKKTSSFMIYDLEKSSPLVYTDKFVNKGDEYSYKVEYVGSTNQLINTIKSNNVSAISGNGEIEDEAKGATRAISTDKGIKILLPDVWKTNPKAYSVHINRTDIETGKKENDYIYYVLPEVTDPNTQSAIRIDSVTDYFVEPYKEYSYECVVYLGDVETEPEVTKNVIAKGGVGHLKLTTPFTTTVSYEGLQEIPVNEIPDFTSQNLALSKMLGKKNIVTKTGSENYIILGLCYVDEVNFSHKLYDPNYTGKFAWNEQQDSTMDPMNLSFDSALVSASINGVEYEVTYNKDHPLLKGVTKSFTIPPKNVEGGIL